MENLIINSSQIQDISKKIVDHINPEKVILFGSYAKGNPNDSSDVDLIVVRNTSLPKHKRAIEIRRLFYRQLIPMDIKVYTPDEFDNELKSPFSFLFSAIKNSQVLYERQS